MRFCECGLSLAIELIVLSGEIDSAWRAVFANADEERPAFPAHVP
jgi:hypothetical protein